MIDVQHFLYYDKGPSIKDVCTHGGGGGVSQKLTHADAGGRGSVAKSGRPQIQIFTKILEV